MLQLGISHLNRTRFQSPIKIKILSFIILILVNPLKAQVENSVYSMFGVGQIIDNSFGINKSLGGTGIAFQSGRSINYLNPASYLGIASSMVMEFGIYGIYNKSENKYSNRTDANINLNYFSSSFYFANWWASSFGIVPFSSVDYEITSADELEGELTTFEKKFSGTGGLNRVYFGNSFEILKGLAVGFNFSYIFGLITQTETALSNDNFTGYELKNERTAHSFYLDFGLQYLTNYNNLLYTVGLIYGAREKLNTSDALEFTYDGTTSFLEQDEQLDIKIPQKLGLGISIKKGNNFRTGFDYEWKNWSSINFSNPNLETKNSNRFSIGAEYSPAQDKNDGLLESLFYRLGANYKNSYLEIDNTRINSIGMNFGIGIPFDKISMINLAIEYGEEGTLNNNLIKNSYWMLYLNISLHELWFTKSSPY